MGSSFMSLICQGTADPSWIRCGETDSFGDDLRAALVLQSNLAVRSAITVVYCFLTSIGLLESIKSHISSSSNTSMKVYICVNIKQLAAG